PRRMRTRLTVVAGWLALGFASAGAWTPAQAQRQPPQGQTQGRAGNQQQARDRTQTPQGTAVIAGRVVAADTGRTVKRARVSVAGSGGMRTMLTDDQGRYQITELAAGSYVVSAAKAGFVDGVYGQRRPLQPGTPVVLADAQSAANIDV